MTVISASILTDPSLIRSMKDTTQICCNERILHRHFMKTYFFLQWHVHSKCTCEYEHTQTTCKSLPVLGDNDFNNAKGLQPFVSQHMLIKYTQNSPTCNILYMRDT